MRYEGGQVAGDVPRRIALITSSFHPHTGGVETHVRAVAGELAARGCSVEVWTVDRGEHLGTGLVDGVPVRYLPTPLPARDGPALLRFGLSVPKALALWIKAFRDLRPQVLHVHCFGPNGIYALALHGLTRTPLFVTSHGETFADDHGIFDRSALLRSALRRALVRAAAVTAPSNFVLSDLRSRFGLNGGDVIPNGVDTAVPAAAPVDVAVEGPMVLVVGRLGRMKGVDLLLQAVADSRLSRTRLVVAGDGEQESALRQQAADLGIADRVHFVGRLTPGEVAATMAAADVVVVPSRHEAFGIVALEAWRAGTPLVGTVHGGMSEFVTDGVDGLLVDPTDHHALAGAVSRVLGDDDLALNLRMSGSVAVAQYGWGDVANSYCGLYVRAQAGGGRVRHVTG